MLSNDFKSLFFNAVNYIVFTFWSTPKKQNRHCCTLPEDWRRRRGMAAQREGYHVRPHSGLLTPLCSLIPAVPGPLKQKQSILSKLPTPPYASQDVSNSTYTKRFLWWKPFSEALVQKKTTMVPPEYSPGFVSDAQAGLRRAGLTAGRRKKLQALNLLSGRELLLQPPFLFCLWSEDPNLLFVHQSWK